MEGISKSPKMGIIKVPEEKKNDGEDAITKEIEKKNFLN